MSVYCRKTKSTKQTKSSKKKQPEKAPTDPITLGMLYIISVLTIQVHMWCQYLTCV